MKNLTGRKFFRIIGAALARATVSALPKAKDTSPATFEVAKNGEQTFNEIELAPADCTNVGIGDGKITFKSATGENLISSISYDSDTGILTIESSGEYPIEYPVDPDTILNINKYPIGIGTPNPKCAVQVFSPGHDICVNYDEIKFV